MPSQFSDSLVPANPSSGLISYYGIADQLLRVHTFDEWETEWVRNFLKGFHLIPHDKPHENPAITLAVRRAPLPTVPPHLNSFAINRGDCHTDGTQYFLRVDESLIHIRAPH